MVKVFEDIVVPAATEFFGTLDHLNAGSKKEYDASILKDLNSRDLNLFIFHREEGDIDISFSHAVAGISVLKGEAIKRIYTSINSSSPKESFDEDDLFEAVMRIHALNKRHAAEPGKMVWMEMAVTILLFFFMMSTSEESPITNTAYAFLDMGKGGVIHPIEHGSSKPLTEDPVLGDLFSKIKK